MKIRMPCETQNSRLAESAECAGFGIMPLNRMSDRVPSTGFDGTLKPHDRLVDPIVVMRRIGFGVLTTDRSLDQALFAPIHHLADRLGLSQLSVTALSMMWR